MPELTKKPQSSASPESAPKRKFPLRSVLILTGIMLVEAAVFGVLMVAMKPRDAGGAQGAQLPAQPVDTSVELELAQFRAVNFQTGATIFYDLKIHLKVDVANKELVSSLVGKHEATLRDRLRTIVAEAEPRSFAETRLTTLKTKVMAMLDTVIGEGMVQEVLILDCTPFRAP